MVASQGRIVLVQLSNTWREKLASLAKPYTLSSSTITEVIRLIEYNPLPQKKSPTKAGWKELGPYDVRDNAELTFTNHHFFLMAWLFTPVNEEVPEGEVLDYRKLMDFYHDGLDSPYAGLARGYRLPKDFSIIHGAAVPDIFRLRYFNL